MTPAKPDKSLKSLAITGMLWSSVHRFGNMSLSFIANVILARLLTPDDFGIIGMIMVFIAVSNTLIDGGFASALIQKKRPTDSDYSTIFFWNLLVSVSLFALLYLTAPYIERFYGMPLLTEVLRIQGIVLIFNAFSVIQFTQLRKKLNFKRLANINIAATAIGSALAIAMAYSGYGVWSLVAKMLFISFFSNIFLWFSTPWRPTFIFSISSFRQLAGFGSYILLTNILIRVYDNIKSLIIGKVFSAGDLGFYTQAKKMEELPVQGLSAVVNQVTFPLFAQLQGNLERMVNGVRASLKAITFINFPLMVLFILIAEPLILLLLTDKWAQSVEYLQILCFGGMAYTLNTINNNIFKALGKSNYYFYTLLGKRVFGLLLIFAGLRYGITGMLWGVAVANYSSFIIGAYFSARLSGYKISRQIKDVFPAYLLSITAGIAVYLINICYLKANLLFTIFISLILYSGFYLAGALLFKLEGGKLYRDIIKSWFKK